MLDKLEEFTEQNKDTINRILLEDGWDKAVAIHKTIAKRTCEDAKEDAEIVIRRLSMSQRAMFEKYDISFRIFNLGYHNGERLFVLYFAFFEPSQEVKYD